jgi:hypothetical protein
MISCGPIRRDYVSSAPLHCRDWDLPSILAGRFNEGDSVFFMNERATLIDDGGQRVVTRVTEIEGEHKSITILKVKGDNGQVYTDPLAWKLGKQGRWARSKRIFQDHWRSIQHTDMRHPDDSEYRTLSLGIVKELRNATANLLSGRGAGGGGGGGGREGGQAASMDDLKTNDLKMVCWDCKRGKFAQKHFSRSRCRQVAGHTACDWRDDPRELHRKRDQEEEEKEIPRRAGDESDDSGVSSSSQQRGQKRRWQDDGEEDDDEMDEEDEQEHEKEIKQQFTQRVNDNGHKCYVKRCDKDFSKVPDQQRNAQITKHMMKCHRHLLEPKSKCV